VYKGIAASPGIAIGKVYLLKEQEVVIDRSRIDEKQIGAEITRYKRAIEKTKQQIVEIRDRVMNKMGEKKAEIFDAHIMILDDPTLANQVENRIKGQLVTAENAVDQVVAELVAIFENMEDGYMRERALDFKDVGARIIKNILGVQIQNLAEMSEEAIVVAKDLTPSDTAQMDKQKVLGFVTDAGGRTSHTAIMARSLEMPAVVGTGDVTQRVKNGQIIIVDGMEGKVIIDPSREEREEYLKKRQKHLEEKRELDSIKHLPAVTIDGRRVELAANIGTPKDVDGALRNGAEGVGLYRTEFLYMDRNSLPGEEEQFEAYKEVAVKMGDHPVIVRTLDIGGDKDLSYIDFPKELNPFLGWRAIRMCIDRPEILKTQLRAILRASKYGNLLIMYPMIISVTEIREANRILKEAKAELRSEGIMFDEDIKVGIMIETPAAAVIADKLVKEVDFFSIGTNDLTQYTLAIDRVNEKISHLYQPLHPSVLRLIKYVIDVSHREGKWTGMCGELAGDEKAIPLLLGMGLDEFSMSSISIPRAKKIIRCLSTDRLKQLVEDVIDLSTPQEVMEHLNTFYDEVLR
jgi:phosphotransferase system enzyme I (PtsI)